MSEFMEYALRALSRRALSEHELRTRMKRRGAPDEEAERIVARLREMGYLNDAEVARMTAQRSGVGRLRVRQTLKQRGVDQDTIEEALQERDPEREREELAALVERHRERWARARDPRAKAFGFLSRRGYLADQIFEAIKGIDTYTDDR